MDTLSLDPGNSADFALHNSWLPAGRYGIEGLNNLEALPIKGATIVIGARQPTEAGQDRLVFWRLFNRNWSPGDGRRPPEITPPQKQELAFAVGCQPSSLSVQGSAYCKACKRNSRAELIRIIAPSPIKHQINSAAAAGGMAVYYVFLTIWVMGMTNIPFAAPVSLAKSPVNPF